MNIVTTKKIRIITYSRNPETHHRNVIDIEEYAIADMSAIKLRVGAYITDPQVHEIGIETVQQDDR